MDQSKSLIKKIFTVRQKIVSPTKNKVNPHFGNEYVDLNLLLATVLSPLTEEGLLLTQPCHYDGVRGSVATVITDSDTGESISSELPIPEGLDAQKIGSAITYFRRYTLSSLLGLGAKDDDANEATGIKTVINDPTPEDVLTMLGQCPKCGGELKPSKYGKGTWCPNCYKLAKK